MLFRGAFKDHLVSWDKVKDQIGFGTSKLVSKNIAFVGNGYGDFP